MRGSCRSSPRRRTFKRQAGLARGSAPPASWVQPDCAMRAVASLRLMVRSTKNRFFTSTIRAPLPPSLFLCPGSCVARQDGRLPRREEPFTTSIADIPCWFSPGGDGGRLIGRMADGFSGRRRASMVDFHRGRNPCGRRHASACKVRACEERGRSRQPRSLPAPCWPPPARPSRTMMPTRARRRRATSRLRRVTVPSPPAR